MYSPTHSRSATCCAVAPIGHALSGGVGHLAVHSAFTVPSAPSSVAEPCVLRDQRTLEPWMCAARGAGVRRRSGSGEKTGIFIAAAFSADSKCRAADIDDVRYSSQCSSPQTTNFQTSRPSLVPSDAARWLSRSSGTSPSSSRGSRRTVRRPSPSRRLRQGRRRQL